jgi:hypothetical protein
MATTDDSGCGEGRNDDDERQRRELRERDRWSQVLQSSSTAFAVRDCKT